jgi:hypothetical protein
VYDILRPNGAQNPPTYILAEIRTNEKNDGNKDYTIPVFWDNGTAVPEESLTDENITATKLIDI